MSEAKRTDAIQGEIIHVYDGIEEADNHLPVWWLATFYGSIIFSVLYWFAYHELGTLPLPNDDYGRQVVARAAAGGELTNDALEALTATSSEVSAGQALFQQHCVTCHAAEGQGQIGPNLTDDRFIHGGNAIDIHTTIRDGVTSKGMPNWGPTLGAANVRRLTAYVASLRGRNVAGKAPEGEPRTAPTETP